MNGAGDLDKRLAALQGTGTRRQLLGKLGLRAVFHAQALVPRKTGNLARTIRMQPPSDDAVRVVAGGSRIVGYAADVEFGTKAHPIVARNRKALRFATGANRRLSGSPRSGAPVVFAKSVWHPGTKAHPYLVPGAFKAMQDAGLADGIVTVWNQAA